MKKFTALLAVVFLFSQVAFADVQGDDRPVPQINPSVKLDELMAEIASLKKAQAQGSTVHDIGAYAVGGGLVVAAGAQFTGISLGTAYKTGTYLEEGAYKAVVVARSVGLVIAGFGTVMMVMSPSKASAGTMTGYFKSSPEGIDAFLKLPAKEMAVYAQMDSDLLSLVKQIAAGLDEHDKTSKPTKIAQRHEIPAVQPSEVASGQ